MDLPYQAIKAKVAGEFSFFLIFLFIKNKCCRRALEWVQEVKNKHNLIAD